MPSREMYGGSSPLARGGLPPCDRQARLGGLIPARAGRTLMRRGFGDLGAAHPRSRGADRCQRPTNARASGSSPLARGGPTRMGGPHMGDGLIPARAGRTLRRAVPTSLDRAHPRSRGADEAHIIGAVTFDGSSPLARGGPNDALRSLTQGRLIPARAGRTVLSCRRRWIGTAHPRSRGADPEPDGAADACQGSSPLARGGLPDHRSSPMLPRLIPARAGRTCSVIAASVALGAHPRSRGADDLRVVRDGRPDGSSPLARGGPWPADSAGDALGLIPARAGRTSASSAGAWAMRAHPRSRGADDLIATAGTTSGGSSPLARGGRLLVRSSGRLGGLIPARAGRTGSLAWGATAELAHPRSRGADARLRVRHSGISGSSPLARGGHHRDHPLPSGRRLIPARAGRTRRSSGPGPAAEAHPRSRGADLTLPSLVFCLDGSSPLARGGRCR